MISWIGKMSPCRPQVKAPLFTWPRPHHSLLDIQRHHHVFILVYFAVWMHINRETHDPRIHIIWSQDNSEKNSSKFIKHVVGDFQRSRSKNVGLRWRETSKMSLWKLPTHHSKIAQRNSEIWYGGLLKATFVSSNDIVFRNLADVVSSRNHTFDHKFDEVKFVT